MADGIKLYQVKGYFIKGKDKIPLTFECRALKETDALEKAYSEIGSRHRVKRDRIFIDKKTGIKTIPMEEGREPEFVDIESEDFVIYTN